MLLIVHSGWFYCLCNKYQEWELNYNGGRRLCPLCHIPDYFDNFEEEPDRAQFDLFKLKMFGFKLFPLLLECYVYGKRFLEAFRGRFCYSSRDRYTGEKKETSLKDQIKFNTAIKNKKQQKNILIFFIAYIFKRACK